MPEPPDDLHEMTDHSLLLKVQAGEQEAATTLYLRYANQLRALAARQSSPALAARVDPDDIVQSVFRTFFRRVVKDQYEVPRGEDLWKLFLVVALNKIRNAACFHNAARRDVRQTIGLAAFPGDVQTPTAPDESSLTILNLVVDEMIARLPATSQPIVKLRIEGHEVADIATQTGRSKRSVERVLQHFREQLKAALDDPAGLQ
jgi:RNA polymerase sigma-70 factor, ECF subfamily